MEFHSFREGTPATCVMKIRRKTLLELLECVSVVCGGDGLFPCRFCNLTFKNKNFLSLETAIFYAEVHFFSRKIDRNLFRFPCFLHLFRFLSCGRPLIWTLLWLILVPTVRTCSCDPFADFNNWDRAKDCSDPNSPTLRSWSCKAKASCFK